MNLEDFKVSKIELAIHLDALYGDLVYPITDNELNFARLFHHYCRENGVLLNFTNPDHFEHFLQTETGKKYIERLYKQRGYEPSVKENQRGRSDAAALGIARKNWLERTFHPILLEVAGFKVINNPAHHPAKIIEWNTSDEALATFNIGNPPYDNIVKILRQTSISHSSYPTERVKDTIIEELWGKNTFKRYYSISHEGTIHPEEISRVTYPNLSSFKEAIQKRWLEILPSWQPTEDDLLPFLIKWIYYDSGLYDPRTAIVVPPSEDKLTTLLVEESIGCLWNKCTFCNFYKDVPYTQKNITEIKQQINGVKILLNDKRVFNRLFLSGGDALSRQREDLTEIIRYAFEQFPEMERATSYASVSSILKQGSQNLTALRKEGLSMVYLGIETGSDDLRRFVLKPKMSDDIYRAGEELSKSGIELSAMIMIGLGGKEYYKKHVEETVNVLNRLKPHYIAFLNTVAYPETPYQEQVIDGTITPLSSTEILQQTKDILDGLEISLKIFHNKNVNRAPHVSMVPLFVADNPIGNLKVKVGQLSIFSDPRSASKALEARIDYLNGADYERLFYPY